ncbi:MAG: hypothetical protein P8102_12845 [Gammaproteobacteria bacterium]
MKRSPVTMIATILLMAPALDAAAPPGRLVLAPAALEARAGPATAAVADVRRLAATGQVGTAVARARTLLGAATLDAPARERLRYETLMVLSQHGPDPSGRRFAEESLDASPTVYVRLDEDAGHEIVVPAWDAPAAARYALRRWETRPAADRVRDLLAAGGDLAGAWLEMDATGRRGALEAIGEAPVAQLQAPAAGLGPRLTDTPALAVPALAVAARTRDADLFSRALAAAPRREAVAALRDGLVGFSSPDRVQVLSAALDRDELASAALLGLGAEAPTEPAAENLLWTLLAHPRHGASAAAALARLPGSAVDERLTSLASRPGETPERHWAGLALTLRHQAAREPGR